MGVLVAVASECQGEARDAHRRAVAVHRLLVEIRPEEWDAILFIGGPGARRVAEDAFARSLARAFAAAGKAVLFDGEGEEVLRRAGVAASALTSA
jgi:putative intracellular protease/amidase